MKRIIEVEETVKIHHQIFVEYDSEEQLDKAIEDESVRIDGLDDYVDNLVDFGIKVVEVNENYSIDVDSIDYYDDYAEE